MQNLPRTSPSGSQRQSRKTEPGGGRSSGTVRASSAFDWKRFEGRRCNSRPSLSFGGKREVLPQELSRGSLLDGTDDFEKTFLEIPGGKEFLKRVNCPFCSEVQIDKVKLIKHLDEGCRGRGHRRGYTMFQILPNNCIKCNSCNVVLRSLELYLSHLRDKDHVSESFRMVTEMEKGISDFFFCSCCKTQVPDNYTQLQCHLQNIFHQVRSRSALHSDYYKRKDIFAIYGFYNNEKRFRCLCCPAPNFLFKGPQEIISHTKTSTHLKYVRQNFYMSLKTYCCLCDEEVLKVEILQHFTSKEHNKNENMTTTSHFQICFYCGFVCDGLRGLFTHWTSDCEEINLIRQQQQQEKRPRRSRAGEHEVREDRSILVKEGTDLAELFQVLKNFGKIIYMRTNFYGHTLIEFQKEASVELIFLSRQFLKVNGEKVAVKLLKELDREEEPAHAENVCQAKKPMEVFKG